MMVLEINIVIIIYFLLVHWVADFIFQSDWEAKNKSKDNKALLSHTISYSLLWGSGVIGLFYFGNVWIALLGAVIFSLITFVCHTVTDYITSRINSRLWLAQRVHDFFVSIGFDQVLHYTQLYITYLFVLNLILNYFL
jgi:hypothetical protein